MRKVFGIVIGCILLCGLVMAAMLAVPPPPNTVITIDGDMETDGVDTPWFELSKSHNDTVQWRNITPSTCKVEFGGQSPFAVDPITINGNGGLSDQYAAINAPDRPKKKADWPDIKVYKVYKYSIKCGSTTFDPGGGMKP